MKSPLFIVVIVVAAFVSGCGKNSTNNDEEKGTLVVLSEPSGAIIYIDGAARSASTPASFELLKGSHTVKVSLLGYNASPDSIIADVLSGGADTASFVLAPISDTAFVYVTADYEAVPVLVDGEVTGLYTPCYVIVSPGEHLVLADGWSFVRTVAESIVVVPAETVAVHFNLSFRNACLVEEFSNVWCTNCPPTVAAVDEAMSAFGDSVLKIEWHPQFGGADPFHLDNPTMHDGRLTYYDVVGLPKVFVAGKNISNPSSSVAIRTFIEGAFSSGSPVALFKLWGHILDDRTAKVGIVANTSGEGRLILAVVEQHRHYESVSWSSGLRDFHDVVRRITVYPVVGRLTLESGVPQLITLNYETPILPLGAEYRLIAWFENDLDGIYHSDEDISCSPCLLDF